MIKVLVKSAWGSDDPTQAAFPFLHANALPKACHEVQIFLLGEATALMRSTLLESIHRADWPPLSETFRETLAQRIRIHV